MQNNILSIDDSLSHEFKHLKKVDFTFLQSFKRAKKEYANINDAALLEAYRSGIYDAMLSILGDSNLKITGTSQTVEDVKKFLRQMSFSGELILNDNNGNQIKTVAEQEAVAECWVSENIDKTKYTQLVLMIPKDNDSKKLSAIVHDFLNEQFKECSYMFVEHTDTDIFHYHVIVEKDLHGDLLEKIKSDFIAVCMKHEARLL